MPVFPRDTKTLGKRWDVAVRIEGVRVMRRGFKTKKEALTAEAALLTGAAKGETLTPGKLTLAAFIKERWLPYKKTRLQPQTYLCYVSVVRHLTEGNLGAKPIGKITPMMVEDFLGTLPGKGLNSTTAGVVFARLRDCLGQAVKWQVLNRNVCAVIEKPSPERHIVPEMDVEKIEALVEAATRHGAGELIFIAIATGMRWGELTALRWDDVDLDARKLYIRKAKTAAGVRAVAFGDQAAAVLEALVMQQQASSIVWGRKWSSAELVFTTVRGFALQPGNFHQSQWSKIRVEAGLDSLHFHDMRHLHAALMVQQNAHPKVMSSRLGHASSRITLELYAHANAADQVAVATAIDGLLSRARAIKGLSRTTDTGT